MTLGLGAPYQRFALGFGTPQQRFALGLGSVWVTVSYLLQKAVEI